LNGPNGNRILQNVTGTYSFWVDENIFYYVPEHKFLGGYFMPYIGLNYARAVPWRLTYLLYLGPISAPAEADQVLPILTSSH